MKNYLILLILFVSTTTLAQDFKFRGKTSSTITQDFNRGDDAPIKEAQSDKKTEVSFDGTTLIIGDKTYKYMWHQNSKESFITQLNCIERVDASDYSYINARFELEFLPDDVLKITQYRDTSPTTFSKILYTINIIKTTK